MSSYTHCYCCTMTVDFIDVWQDLFEDGPLIECLFETGIIPEELQIARVGMAILIEGAHSDKPIYLVSLGA